MGSVAELAMAEVPVKWQPGAVPHGENQMGVFQVGQVPWTQSTGTSSAVYTPASQAVARG